ncbi:MAG: GIY-YIG nuclease family protein [Verrucomicrobiota bacterium]|jgi:hypothetical protein
MLKIDNRVASDMAVTKRQSLYLAGALPPNGWRHLLVQGFSDEPISADEFRVLDGALFGRFDYVGPFPVMIRTDEYEIPDKFEHDKRTWNLRRLALDRADVVFGWIESNEAYATIAELAYAPGKGKLVRYALSAELGRLGPNGNRRLFPEIWRTFSMFDCGIDLCLSPRMAFARLFSLPQADICNVPEQSAVYFIENNNTERIKIGVSTDPEKRRSELQTGSADPLRLIGSIPGGLHLESKLHSDFAHLRLQGEWFHATQELRGFIEVELGLRQPQVGPNDLVLDSCGNSIVPMNYVPKLFSQG